jgi:hypothetical protein
MAGQGAHSQSNAQVVGEKSLIIAVTSTNARCVLGRFAAASLYKSSRLG